MTETFDEILRKALQFQGSDIFVVPGSQIMTKVSGKMIPITEEKALPNDIAVLVDRAYELAGRSRETLDEEGDDDFSFAVRDLSRFRCNTYRQRGSLAMTCRMVTFGIPDAKEYSSQVNGDDVTKVRLLVGRSNPNAVSDLAVSALSLKAAMQGAWLNVLINIGSLKDPDQAEYFRARGGRLLAENLPLADEIYETVKKKM